jgi:hypothetical protein
MLPHWFEDGEVYLQADGTALLPPLASRIVDGDLAEVEPTDQFPQALGGRQQDCVFDRLHQRLS